MPVQIKTRGKANGKCDQESRNIRADSANRRVDHLFFQQKVVAQKIQHDIQYRIPSSTSRIPEGLQRDEFAERRVKKINK